MNIERINLDFILTSPLLHFGDEPAGTMQTLRRQKFWIDDEYKDIPVYSGNALRGILRTLVMRDYFERIGYGIKSISQSLFYTFFNGGSLKSGGVENLAFKDDIKKNCPPLVLLGSAYGNQMTEGKLKVGIVKPVCSELNDYNRTKTNCSVFSGMLQEVFHTRADRLKPSVETTADYDTAIKEVVQMKYEVETLSAGTRLESELIVEFADELEKSCLYHMIELLKESKHLGGKASAGYGGFELIADSKGNGKLYTDFIEENKEQIQKFIENMEMLLNA